MKGYDRIVLFAYLLITAIYSYSFFTHNGSETLSQVWGWITLAVVGRFVFLLIRKFARLSQKQAHNTPR